MVSHGEGQNGNQVSRKHLLKRSAKVIVCSNVSDLGICVSLLFNKKTTQSVNYILLQSLNISNFAAQLLGLSSKMCEIRYSYQIL